MPRWVIACAALALLLATFLPLAAQQLMSGSSASTPLPEAPSAVQAQQAGTASITGLVSDVNGGLVPGATIKLTEKGRSETREATSESDGVFSFTGLEPGTYTVTIASPGLETFQPPPIVIRPGERYELQHIALPIATATTTVNVVMTQSQIADEELKIETHQRILGAIPNFYTSFLWDAAPMNTKQKFKLAVHARTDPAVFITTAITAGIEQANNTFPEYGDGWEGYGKRYGAAYGDSFIGRTLGSAVFPSIFRQDPRYFFMGPSQSFGKRFKHAILSGIIVRGDNGKSQPNYSHMAGNASAGALSSLYHPDSNSVGKLVGLNVLVGIAGGGVQGLVREFVYSRVTTKVPKYATGKPAAKTSAAVPAKPVPVSPQPAAAETPTPK